MGDAILVTKENNKINAEDLNEILGTNSPDYIVKLAEYLTSMMDSKITDMRTEMETLLKQQVSEKCRQVNDECKLLKYEMKHLKIENDKLKKKFDDQEAYSRRSNLIFANVPENDDEILLDWFNALCLDTLKVLKTNEKNEEEDDDEESETPPEYLKVERIHRLGPKIENNYARRPRDIIVRFAFYPDQQKVWKSRKQLNNSGIFMNLDYTKDVLEKRRRLLPIAKEARDQSMQATVIGDRLLVDGTFYATDELYQLPPSLHAISNSQRETPSQISFFRKYSKLSNHYDSKFVLKDQVYNCNEQYFLSQKCKIHGHFSAARAIMESNDPGKMVQIAKICGKARCEPWNEQQYDIMKDGASAKFHQNRELKEYLISTGMKILVEGSRWDTTWGVGIDFNDPAIDDMAAWKGDNLLGKVLSEIRHDLHMERQRDLEKAIAGRH